MNIVKEPKHRTCGGKPGVHHRVTCRQCGCVYETENEREARIRDAHSFPGWVVETTCPRCQRTRTALFSPRWTVDWWMFTMVPGPEWFKCVAWTIQVFVLIVAAVFVLKFAAMSLGG